MTDQARARWDRWMPVLLTVGPLMIAAWLGYFSMERAFEARLAVLEARISMHEQASSEVSAAVERRLATIETDIKSLLKASK